MWILTSVVPLLCILLAIGMHGWKKYTWLTISCSILFLSSLFGDRSIIFLGLGFFLVVFITRTWIEWFLHIAYLENWGRKSSRFSPTKKSMNKIYTTLIGAITAIIALGIFLFIKIPTQIFLVFLALYTAVVIYGSIKTSKMIKTLEG